jgi:PST family polysaccharide transporter/lipopolysaccharide exporter
MPEGLREKAISGVKWRFAGSYGTQLVRLVGAFVLAWLLDERDYGLAGAAMAVVMLVCALGDLGMDCAIVQRRERVQEAVSSAFFLLVAVAVASYGILFVVGRHTTAYAANHTLFLVVGLVLFLRPLAIVADGALVREFHFKQLFTVDVVSAVLSTALAVGLACLLPRGRRYWALAASGLVREGARALGAWWYASVKPRLRFDRAVARELLDYGKYFVGGAIVAALCTNLERFALSELLTLAATGLYIFAYNWTVRVGDVSGNIFGRVSLSVYACVQDDVPRLRESFCRIVRLSALLSTGLLTGMVLLAPEGVALAFPPRWAASVPIFQVLGLWCLLRSVGTLTGQLYAAIGKPKYSTALAVVNLAVMATALVPLIVWWGPVGAAWALVAARGVRLACNAAICRRVLQCSARRLVAIVMPALKAGSVMAAVLCIAQVALLRWVVACRPGWIGSSFEWLAFGGLVALGAAVYAAAVYALERELFHEVVGLVRDALPERWRSADASDS